MIVRYGYEKEGSGRARGKTFSLQFHNRREEAKGEERYIGLTLLTKTTTTKKQKTKQKTTINNCMFIFQHVNKKHDYISILP